MTSSTLAKSSIYLRIHIHMPLKYWRTLKNIEEPCVPAVPAVPGLYSKEFLENRMCVALGGRLAEEIINGKDNVTTGASNDFQQCNSLVNGYWWLLYQLSSHGFMLRLLRLLSSVQIHGKMRSKSPNYC